MCNLLRDEGKQAPLFNYSAGITDFFVFGLLRTHSFVSEKLNPNESLAGAQLTNIGNSLEAVECEGQYPELLS
jgi:hypothetical protein